MDEMIMNNTNHSETDAKQPGNVIYIISAFTFGSVVVSVIVLTLLCRQTSKHVCNWKVIERFTLYNVLSDLFYAISKFIFSIQVIVFKNKPQYAICSVYTIITFEFSYSQIVVALVMATYGYALICRNRHLPLGKYDFRLLVPTFGIPSITFALALYFQQIEVDETYCGLRQEEGFDTMYFWLSACIILSFVVIAILYLLIWRYVYKTNHDNTLMLQQQTTVNTRRLAFKLSLYVVVYVIQFGGVAFEGFMVSIRNVPYIVRVITILGSLSGGIINGIVFHQIRIS